MEVEAEQGLETEQMLKNGPVLRDKTKVKVRSFRRGKGYRKHQKLGM